MTKISNQYSLTNILTADLANSRLGINNVSPTVALDVTGAGKFSGALAGTTATFSGNGNFGSQPLQSWGSIFKAIQIGVSGSIVSATSATETDIALYSNTYYDGTNYKILNSTTQVPSYFQLGDGTIQLYTGNAGAIGSNVTGLTSKFIVTKTGNVGIGTTSPTGAAGLALVLNSGTSQGRICIKTSATGDASGDGLQIGVSGTGAFIEQRENAELTLSTNASERIRILAAGNVGIGTSSPSTLLHVAGTITGVSNDNYSGDALKLTTKAGPTSYYMNIYPTDAGAGGITWTFAQKVGTTIYDNVMVMRLGNLLIGRTDAGLSNGNGVTLGGGSIQAEANSYIIYGNRTSSDGLFMGIRRNNADVGSITVTTSATAFNTSSDYRLKTDFKDYNGLSLINSIKTYDYAWAIDNTRSYGVKAHELQELLPYMVFGEKDAINEDNSIKPQAVDYSKLVPVLVKAIQELSAKVSLLENK